MSPTAVYSQPEQPTQGTAAPSKGPALVIGSLSTADDGKYQSLISELESTRTVEKQLLDRLVDEGMSTATFWLLVRASLRLSSNLSS